MRCPTCDAPSPELHPAMQWEGEIELCLNPYHVPSFLVACKVMDILRDAVRHIAGQFHVNLTASDALANLQARQMLMSAEASVFKEAEDKFGARRLYRG